MDVSAAEAGQGSIALVLIALIGWVVRWKLTRDAAREDREVDARIKRENAQFEDRSRREERAVAAAEAQAQATAAQAVAMTRMADAMNCVGTKVDELAGVVQGMRDDIDEITDAQSPEGKRKRKPVIVEDSADGAADPPRHQPIAGGFRAPARGGRDR